MLEKLLKNCNMDFKRSTNSTKEGDSVLANILIQSYINLRNKDLSEIIERFTIKMFYF